LTCAFVARADELMYVREIIGSKLISTPPAEKRFRLGGDVFRSMRIRAVIG
jgi:hypothetical protein